MNMSRDRDDECGGSAPCLLHELGPDGAPADARQAADVARWRKAERERLIALRCALPAEERARHTSAIGRKLEELLSTRSNDIVSVYWPIRAEPDLRSWMEEACLRGLRIALPVAVAAPKPLAIGVGYPQLHLPTIFPQSYDIPMDWIVPGLEPARQRPRDART